MAPQNRCLALVAVCCSTHAFRPAPRRPPSTPKRATPSDADDRGPAQLTARNLLYLGTAVFPVGDVACATFDVAPAAFASYAGVIIAYIGGLQQATACALGLRPALVVSGIGVAIAGWLCAAAAAAGFARPALLCLALLYAAQLAAESFAPPWAELSEPARAGMLTSERKIPMVVGAATLAVAALTQ